VAALPLNLPNAVTLGRIGFVPLVARAMRDARRGGSPALAAGMFGAAALSDALDGHLARARASETAFGEVLDPLADKALIAAALGVLVGQDRLGGRAAASIVARELAVTGLRLLVGRRKGVVIPASRLGKRKATLQVACVLVLILAPDPDAAWVKAVVSAAVALTVASGVEYFAGLSRRLAAASREGTGR
jgi:CDP-diacylglycerol--glycerol-3-phosphate 3-phosphatidyltransferase